MEWILFVWIKHISRPLLHCCRRRRCFFCIRNQAAYFHSVMYPSSYSNKISFCEQVECLKWCAAQFSVWASIRAMIQFITATRFLFGLFYGLSKPFHNHLSKFIDWLFCAVFFSVVWNCKRSEWCSDDATSSFAISHIKLSNWFVIMTLIRAF